MVWELKGNSLPRCWAALGGVAAIAGYGPARAGQEGTGTEAAGEGGDTDRRSTGKGTDGAVEAAEASPEAVLVARRKGRVKGRGEGKKGRWGSEQGAGEWGRGEEGK